MCAFPSSTLLNGAYMQPFAPYGSQVLLQLWWLRSECSNYYRGNFLLRYPSIFEPGFWGPDTFVFFTLFIFDAGVVWDSYVNWVSNLPPFILQYQVWSSGFYFFVCWNAVVRVSLTSSFCKIGSGTCSYNLPDASTWCFLHNVQCTALATLSWRFLYSLCEFWTLAN